MQKAQRDSVLSRLSGADRQNLRRVIAAIQEPADSPPRNGANGGRITPRQLLETYGAELPASVRSALETIIVRDETGPKVGEIPPDFSLKRLGTEERVSLTDFQGRRPVALAFGSYT